jgi:hypothetical protein
MHLLCAQIIRKFIIANANNNKKSKEYPQNFSASFLPLKAKFISALGIICVLFFLDDISAIWQV